MWSLTVEAGRRARITGGNLNDTTIMTAVLEAFGRHILARGGPECVSIECWPRRGTRRKRTARGCGPVASPRRSSNATTRSLTEGRRPGRPIDFCLQQERYKGRNVVERCFNRLKQWRGIAMRSDKLSPQLPRRALPRRHHDLDQTALLSTD